MTLQLVSRKAERCVADDAVLERARQALTAQSSALRDVATRLNHEFCRAVDLIVACKGRVVVCGMGKSGLIGRKTAATFSCSGTPSCYLHPGEASYGDLGMVTRDDVLVLISNSGSTEELTGLLPYFREIGAPIIAMVGNLTSPVARAARAVLDISVDRETCPHNLVPTTSALSTLALGDALAVAAMLERQFTPDDLARIHPGGALGQRTSQRVADVMRARDLPLASADVSIREALLTMSAGRLGLVVIVSDDSNPIGIITDGDLRRGLQATPDLLNLSVSDVMTTSPITIRKTASIIEARDRMRRLRIKALIVVDALNRVVGVVDIFDE